MAEVELIMPKMGESIIEATIIAWLKSEGDQVEADETILEVATDKVDSEVPSPVSGVIKKILHPVDTVVPVGASLAIIETQEKAQLEEVTPEIPSEAAPDIKIEEPIKAVDSGASRAPQANTIHEETIKTPLALERLSLTNKIPSFVEGKFYSPLVRNIAKTEGITLEELSLINGSGADNRVTKIDLLNYIDQKKIGGQKTIVASAPLQSTSTPIVNTPKIKKGPQSEPVVQSSNNAAVSNGSDEVIALSRMRKVIASHMRNSLDTSAHVSSFVEADATRLVTWRNKIKGEYLKKYGEKITLSPLFTEVVIQALREFPQINAALKDDQLIIKKSINIGVATAMKNGNLIVPVIKEADQLNLHGLTKKLNDLTARARENALQPDEIQGGTFTISNIGTFGNIMGTPIINQPQLAILALGAIKKKPVIQETSEGDIIAIRHMMFLSLSFDHRVIDGYLGGTFLNRIAHYIESFDTNRSF